MSVVGVSSYEVCSEILSVARFGSLSEPASEEISSEEPTGSTY